VIVGLYAALKRRSSTVLHAVMCSVRISEKERFQAWPIGCAFFVYGEEK